MASKGRGAGRANMSFKSSSGSWLPWLAWSLVVILVDQFTKVLVLGYYQLGDSHPVTSFFNLVRVHNHGAAFSFLASSGGWQRWLFTGIGIGAAVLIIWLLRSHPGQKLFAFALASILGGALGNVIDRLLHGYVVDFLDFSGTRIFPWVFNVADSAICIGVALLVWYFVRADLTAKRKDAA